MVSLTAEEEQAYRQHRDLIGQLRPIDDDFMRAIFSNNRPLAQLVLRIITGIKDLKIIEEVSGYDLHKPGKDKSICLDVFGEDSEGRLYDIEIQRSDCGAVPRRARYYSSALDNELLRKGYEYNDMPDAYVIFITENDIFKEGKSLYPIERINTATGRAFDDGEHIIYVNGAYDNREDDSDLAKLIRDFRSADYKEMHFQLMAETVRYYKEETKGVANMCKLIEDRIQETLEDRVKDRIKERLIKSAANMLKLGKLTIEEISACSDLTIEEVTELAEKLKCQNT